VCHSKPNALIIFFIPVVNQCDSLLILLPRLTAGRFGPSKTKTGKNGMLIRRAHRKNMVRSSGFSPSLPPAAWKNQMDASIPIRKPRFPEVFDWNPSTTARCVSERGLPAGLSTCNKTQLATSQCESVREHQLTSQRPATPIQSYVSRQQVNKEE
jgi:hypothetical protein